MVNCRPADGALTPQRRVSPDVLRWAPDSCHSCRAASGHEATVVAWSKLVSPATTGASHGIHSLHDNHSRTLEEGNKGKLVGQKAPFKLKEIRAIRVRLQLANRRRELALFNLAIDSKLRACDPVRLRVRDVCHGGGMVSRAIVQQQKTQRPVQFEITEPTRDAIGAWIRHAGLTAEDPLFPSRVRKSAHLSTRQYARIADSWVEQLGLDRADYGTHTLRRATLGSRSTTLSKWRRRRRCSAAWPVSGSYADRPKSGRSRL
jgi:integrase